MFRQLLQFIYCALRTRHHCSMDTLSWKPRLADRKEGIFTEMVIQSRDGANEATDFNTNNPGTTTSNDSLNQNQVLDRRWKESNVNLNTESEVIMAQPKSDHGLSGDVITSDSDSLDVRLTNNKDKASTSSSTSDIANKTENNNSTLDFRIDESNESTIENTKNCNQLTESNTSENNTTEMDGLDSISDSSSDNTLTPEREKSSHAESTQTKENNETVTENTNEPEPQTNRETEEDGTREEAQEDEEDLFNEDYDFDFDGNNKSNKEVTEEFYRKLLEELKLEVTNAQEEEEDEKNDKIWLNFTNGNNSTNERTFEAFMDDKSRDIYTFIPPGVNDVDKDEEYVYSGSYL